MSADWIDIALNELMPTMASCEVVASLVPETETDVKFALELGMAIMLDKPIIAIVRPGTSVPAKLMRVADAVIEGDITTGAGRRSLIARLDQEAERLLGDE